jgi:CRISPR-associated protein Cas2
VANSCIGYGQRVQQSVFECTLTPEQLIQFEHRLLKQINIEEDSLRIYRLVEPLERTTHVYGRNTKIDLRGPLIV